MGRRACGGRHHGRPVRPVAAADQRRAPGSRPRRDPQHRRRGRDAAGTRRCGRLPGRAHGHRRSRAQRRRGRAGGEGRRPGDLGALGGRARLPGRNRVRARSGGADPVREAARAVAARRDQHRDGAGRGHAPGAALRRRQHSRHCAAISCSISQSTRSGPPMSASASPSRETPSGARWNACTCSAH